MNQSSPSTPSESSPSESTSSPLTMEEAYNLCMTGDHFLPISDAVKDSNNVMELKYRLAMVELLRIKERILREHQLETPITIVSSAIEDAQLTIWRRSEDQRWINGRDIATDLEYKLEVADQKLKKMRRDIVATKWNKTRAAAWDDVLGGSMRSGGGTISTPDNTQPVLAGDADDTAPFAHQSSPLVLFLRFLVALLHPLLCSGLRLSPAHLAALLPRLPVYHPASSLLVRCFVTASVSSPRSPTFAALRRSAPPVSSPPTLPSFVFSPSMATSNASVCSASSSPTLTLAEMVELQAKAARADQLEAKKLSLEREVSRLKRKV
ncbi:hypothetical protein IWZ00DRAFT_494139 [Phyllosticta capitalensis]